MNLGGYTSCTWSERYYTIGLLLYGLVALSSVARDECQTNMTHGHRRVRTRATWHLATSHLAIRCFNRHITIDIREDGRVLSLLLCTRINRDGKLQNIYPSSKYPCPASNILRDGQCCKKYGNSRYLLISV